MKRIISRLTLLIFCTAFLAGCGSTPPADIALKQAMVAVGKAESFQFDINFSATIDDKVMPRDNESYVDFYAYAEGSNLAASNKIMFTDKSRTVGLILSDVSYTWARKDDNDRNMDDAANVYKFTVITSFNFKNLEKNKPSMSLVQAYKFTQLPKRIWGKIPEIDGRESNYRDKYFSINHSDNEILKEYFRKMLAKSVPNWGEMLSTLNWKMSKKDYVVNISQEVIKETARQMLDSFKFNFSDEDKTKIDNLFNAIQLDNTGLAYTLGGNGRLDEAKWTFNGMLDYYALSNSILGRINGFDIKIPIKAVFNIKFSAWDEVEKFTFPTLSDVDTINHVTTMEYLPDVWPKLNKIAQPYIEDQIVVNVNGKKIEFFENYPPCIVDDKVYLPLKFMYQTRGGSVTSELGADGRWKATAKAGVKTSVLLQNSSRIALQGADEALSAPIIVHWDYNTFYAPYDLYTKAFDMECEVDLTQKTSDGKNKFIFDFTSEGTVAGR